MGPGGIIVHARVACFFPWRLLKNAAADAPEIDAIQLVGQDRWNYPDKCLRNQIVPLKPQMRWCTERTQRTLNGIPETQKRIRALCREDGECACISGVIINQGLCGSMTAWLRWLGEGLLPLNSGLRQGESCNMVSGMATHFRQSGYGHPLPSVRVWPPTSVSQGMATHFR
jgi:hypothetical protein